MYTVVFYYIFLLLIHYVCSTDIAVIYGHDVFILRNVHNTSKINTTIHPESLSAFEYPTALTYDFIRDQIFIADANNEDTEIFSIYNNDQRVKVPVISKVKQSLVDAVAYDPFDQLLIWTDSYKHGIFSINLLKLNSSYQSNVIAGNKVTKPRGIAIDFCNRDIYWTERDNSRPSIKKYNLNDKKVEIFKNAKPGFFYQGLSYNFQNNELVWAETFGDDERNSSCNIVQKYLHNNEENVIGSFENCYPFAITSDYDNVYWSDWGRNGIMRLSKDNVSENLTKLFSTPPLETDEGHHNGAFGITNLRKLSSAKIKEVCLERYPKNKMGNSQNGNIRQSNASEEQRVNSTDNQSASYDDKFDLNYLKKIHKMKIIIIFLVCSCSFLFFVTLFLIIRNLMNSRCMDGIRKCCANTIGKGISSSPVKSKTHRRYKPKMISRRGSLCAKENDGVKIDIEDCCQMTLCETPCFTTIKKEGKGYKAPKKSSQDKEKLLCDLENI